MTVTWLDFFPIPKQIYLTNNTHDYFLISVTSASSAARGFQISQWMFIVLSLDSPYNDSGFADQTQYDLGSIPTFHCDTINNSLLIHLSLYLSVNLSIYHA